jgi:hypothetical protein
VSSCLLEIDGHVVLTSRDGPPDAESALFEGGDIELEASRPGTNLERGYGTTVAVARQRLAAADITAELTAAAMDLVRPSLARSYARGSAARCIVERLQADELFESRSFNALTGRYEGTWLDMTGLARDLARPNAAVVLQALHLAALLAGQSEEATVFLSTAEIARRPGARTLRRIDLSGARELVDALRELHPSRSREAAEAGPSRGEVIAWLRESAIRLPAQQSRFAAMEAALTAREPPTRGPLSETALWNIEVRLTGGDLQGVLEQIDALEKRRGRAPGTTYLRERLALLVRSEPPQAIAERASALSTSMGGFHELELLAAQAWLAAGDQRRARAFARDLYENTSADDVLRMQALSVLEAAGLSSSATLVAAPPSERPLRIPTQPSRLSANAVANAPTELQAPAEGHEPDPVSIPRAPRAPSASELSSSSGHNESSGQHAPVQAGQSGPMAPLAATRARGTTSRGTLPPGTSFPPFRIEARGERVLIPLAADAEHPPLETLALPPGAEERLPRASEPPRTPAAARVACTQLARELGRELRLRHGVEINADVDGLEVAQRYLRETFVDGRVRTAVEEREIMRHGAFVSELIARRLSGAWVEVQSRDAGSWAMLIPIGSRPDDVVRVWPFGRVLRFVVMGHKERDLVSYYLELEARAR